MRTAKRRALWVSPGISGRGGISTLIYDMQSTELWRKWDVRHVGTHCEGSSLKRVARFAIALPLICYEVLVHRPDVAHIHLSARGSFARKATVSWICFALRIPVVLQVHGSNFDEFFEESPKWLQSTIRRTLEHADVVIGLGQTWAARLQHMAPSAHVATITSAVRFNKPVTQPASGTVHFIFLGEIGDRKGTFVLLQAWQRMMTESKFDAKLTIAGNGDISRARQLSAELGVESTVQILGWISSADVAKLIERSHVLVLPSRNEGTPRAILEAMANGLCVIASDVGGIPELIGDAGVSIKPDDVEGLAQALRAVITDYGMRSALGLQAFSRVKENFDLDATSARFDALYRDVLERSVCEIDA